MNFKLKNLFTKSSFITTLKLAAVGAIGFVFWTVVGIILTALGLMNASTTAFAGVGLVVLILIFFVSGWIANGLWGWK